MSIKLDGERVCFRSVGEFGVLNGAQEVSRSGATTVLCGKKDLVDGRQAVLTN